MSNFEAQFHRGWPCGCGTSTGECQKHADERDKPEEEEDEEGKS